MSQKAIHAAIERTEFARGYSKQLCEGLSPDQWFWQPTEGVTHVAWQVAHLAVAQYGLTMKRIRGERAEDADVIPTSFLTQFGRGSVPDPDPKANPTVEEIVSVWDRVHRQSLREIGQYTDEQLDVPADPRHPAFSTNLGAVNWSWQHELTHCGQISLLRRLMGKPPLR